jgi:hypothetical protein
MHIYEHRVEPLAPRALFLRRLARSFVRAASFVALSLVIGVVGYHTTEGLPWIDALLNAAMILGGMGPVDQIKTLGGKLFASAYALYSGFFVLVAAGLMVAPAVHRFLHRLDLETHRHRDVKWPTYGEADRPPPV